MTNRPEWVVIHVADDDDHYYRCQLQDVIESMNTAQEERLAWLGKRWEPTRIHSGSEVDVIIVPEDYEGWDAFAEYVEEAQ